MYHGSMCAEGEPSGVRPREQPGLTRLVETIRNIEEAFFLCIFHQLAVWLSNSIPFVHHDFFYCSTRNRGGVDRRHICPVADGATRASPSCLPDLCCKCYYPGKLNMAPQLTSTDTAPATLHGGTHPSVQLLRHRCQMSLHQRRAEYPDSGMCLGRMYDVRGSPDKECFHDHVWCSRARQVHGTSGHWPCLRCTRTADLRDEDVPRLLQERPSHGPG